MIADAILAQLPLLVAEQRALAAAERWHQARCSFDEHSAARAWPGDRGDDRVPEKLPD
jgi:hypothetical protein